MRMHGLLAAIQHIEAGQTDDIIRLIYQRHKLTPKSGGKPASKRWSGYHWCRSQANLKQHDGESERGDPKTWGRPFCI